MQVDDVIGMVVRHDDRVEADRRGGPEQRQQPRQRPVAEIERHPEPVVLEQEPAARTTRFGPGATAAQDHHPAIHPSIVSRLDCDLRRAARLIRASAILLPPTAREHHVDADDSSASRKRTPTGDTCGRMDVFEPP